MQHPYQTASRGTAFSWSRQYRRRRNAQARFGRIFDLPIAKRARDVAAACVADGERVLEVGAGDRRLAHYLRQAAAGVQYESVDIDPHGQHDYRSLTEPAGPYDGIVALEVIEHLELAEIPAWLSRLAELLRPGGWLVLSTPNVYYPPDFLRDVTHRTPLCYDELAGLVSAAGLEVVSLRRIYNDALHRKLLRRYAFGWLFRLIGIDYARQIVLVARRRGDERLATSA
jgi:SAM-dependent methyltransferase